MRQACIDILYEFVSQTIPISRQGYENSLYGWTLEPIELCGDVVGCIMLRDNEIHIAMKPGINKHWPRRWMIREYIAKRIEKYSHLVTSVDRNNPVAVRIVERLGFYRTGEDGKFIQYRIDHATIK